MILLEEILYGNIKPMVYDKPHCKKNKELL